MKILLFVVFALCSLSISAAGSGENSVDGTMGFFSFASSFFSDISNFLFVTIPESIDKAHIWVTSFLLKLKFFAMYESLKFSHEVALSFLNLIDISSFVNSAISALPQDMKQLASDLRFFESLTLVVEAWITRMVYSGIM